MRRPLQAWLSSGALGSYASLSFASSRTSRISVVLFSISAEKIKDLPAMKAELKEMRVLVTEIVGAIKAAQGGAPQPNQPQDQPMPEDGNGNENGNGNGEPPLEKSPEQIAHEQSQAEIDAIAAQLAEAAKHGISAVVPIRQPAAAPQPQAPGPKPAA